LFTRADHWIAIRKTAPKTLMISGGAAEERFDFDTVTQLVGFQTGFEAHLLDAGWSLRSFSPQRKQRSDRRLLIWLLRRRR
jgi:hypothetical protein